LFDVNKTFLSRHDFNCSYVLVLYFIFRIV